MSSNKTTNYNLHSWLPEDDFLRTEINENFAKMDTALKTAADALNALVVTGTYTGDGQESQFIAMGFRPRVLFVSTYRGFVSYSYSGTSYHYGGMALADYPVNRNGANIISTEPAGFQVYKNTEIRSLTNEDKTVYYYTALR